MKQFTVKKKIIIITIYFQSICLPDAIQIDKSKLNCKEDEIVAHIENWPKFISIINDDNKRGKPNTR